MMFWTILVLSAFTEIDTARKKWIGQSTWNESGNWINGLPTGCDTGLIESNQILTLTAHGNIGELSFSGNSAIMFNSLSEISFGQGTLCNEVEADIKFYEAPRDDFLAVENWEVYSELEDIDVLDVHKVPCVHDIIELPYRGVKAELRNPMEVGVVSYGGQFLSRAKVQTWLNSADGRNELRLLSTFNVNGVNYCKTKGGCECGNKATCNDTQCKLQPPCENPVKSPGMCCPVCGTAISLPVNYNSSYRQLQLQLSTILSHKNIKEPVKMGIINGELHIIIEEGRSGQSRHEELADVITQKLLQDNYTTSSQIKVQRSKTQGGAKADPTIQISGLHQTNYVLIVILILIIVCLILCGIVLLYITKKKVRALKGNNETKTYQQTPGNAYDVLEGDAHIYETIPHHPDNSKITNYSPISMFPVTESSKAFRESYRLVDRSVRSESLGNGDEHTSL